MSINSVNFTGKEQAQSKHRALLHLANNTGVAVGTGVIGTLLLRGVQKADAACGDRIALSNGSKIFKRNYGSIYNAFEKYSEKIFNDKTLVGKAIKRFVTGELPSGGRMSHPEQIAALVKKYKTVGLMGLAATIPLLLLITKGLYNAGKINADE